MKVRTFRLGDYEAITLICRETGLEQQEKTHILDALAKQLGWDSELVLVAEQDEKVIGVIVGTMDGTRGYFHCLAVNPVYQRQGIGSEMIRVLERRFQQKGANSIFVVFNQGNKDALAFYKTLGYEVQEYITLSKILSS